MMMDDDDNKPVTFGQLYADDDADDKSVWPSWAVGVPFRGAR
jgi:hypothetical protein